MADKQQSGIVVVMGPTGFGKSTFIQLVTGNQKASIGNGLGGGQSLGFGRLRSSDILTCDLPCRNTPSQAISV